MSVLKIVSAKVIVTCPGRNFVTLKIETSDGVTRLGQTHADKIGHYSTTLGTTKK